jgi:plasmid replication initiation protein
VPGWFYTSVLDNALVLTIDRAYFDLIGGLERWLYRMVRKHAGGQPSRWTEQKARSPPSSRSNLLRSANGSDSS